MRPINIPTVIALTLAISSRCHAYEAHEWGTFTSLVGSDGVTQDGMSHEDEALPDFVHRFGELAAPSPLPNPAPVPPRNPCHGKSCFTEAFFRRNAVTQKMETPVIYFYSKTPQTVKIDVRFPQGLITETYPGPVSSYPLKSDAPTLGNGRATFQVDILNTIFGKLPGVADGNIYGHARNVASNLVRTYHEEEKFIFYRGLGRFQPRFDIKSSGGALKFSGTTDTLPKAAFLVHVSVEGRAKLLELGDLSSFAPCQPSFRVGADLIRSLMNHAPEDPDDLKKVIGARLVEAGLHADEAAAMLDTWENGYLKVPGLRLLYILPRAEVDGALPLTMTPAPENLARVFVGRIEILLDTQEASLLSQVREQGEDFQVASLGRFAEPMLRRVAQVYHRQDPNDSEKLRPVFEHLIDRATLGQNSAGAVLH